ncbi:hypothetical protein BDV93DRAFT_167132 [Ceratobasidium sp. AG-I]|nr:hypothetical protein BDV93DRAFT_167132 [Ceratobasidium sp. AG-I]
MMASVKLINTLPEEIVTKILLYCHYGDILRFSMTCKAYCKSVTSSSVLQLQIELQSNGFQLSDRPYRQGAEGSAARLLEEFKRYRDGWLYLKFGEPKSLEQVGEDMRLYELRQGYYAAALSSTQDLPGIVKLVDLNNTSTRLLSLGLQFSEFQIDPSQGLMVLVALEDHISRISSIHLRTFDRGNRHQEARYPDWKIELPFYVHQRFTGIFVEVMSDLLAVKYVSYERNVSEILIWNWRLGILLNRIQCFAASCTFGFLTPSSLMLFHSNSHQNDSAVTLSIYEDICIPTTVEKDEKPICSVSDYEPMTPRFELGFPFLPPSSSIQLLLRAEPAPTITSSGLSTFVPFVEARIVQLGMTVIQNQGQRGLHYYQIFISKEKLLQHLIPPEPDPDLDHQGSAIKIPWDSWGEYTTRWFATTSAVSPWICRAYGTRFVLSIPLDNEDDESEPLEYISVLDFHTPTVRRFSTLSRDKNLSMWCPPEARRHIDLHSPVIDTMHVSHTLQRAQESLSPLKDRVFVDTISEDIPSITPFNGDTLVTRLPYRVVTRVRPVPKHSGWMIDNDNIIGMPSMDDRAMIWRICSTNI